MVREDVIGNLTTNRFVVEGSTNTITFNGSELNKTIQLKIPITQGGVPCIGGDTPSAEFYNIGLQGQFFTTAGDGPYTILIPQLRRVSAPTMVANGDKVVFRIRYQAVCGGDETLERKPFRIFAPSSLDEIPNYLVETGFNFLLETGSLFLLENA